MVKDFLKLLWNKIHNGSFRSSISVSIGIHSTFESHCQLHPHVQFKGHLGYGSYVGPYSKISAKIGRFTSIASYVCTVAGRHAYQAPFATTCPMFFSLNPNHSQSGSTFATEQMFEELKFAVPEKQLDVEIGNDVWIGERAMIIGGVHIGDHVKIGAGAIVVDDVPSNSTVVCDKARVLVRSRTNCSW